MTLEQGTHGRIHQALDWFVLGGVWILSGVPGLIIAAIGLLGIVDPVGSQFANDSNPHGAPPPVWWGFVLVSLGSVLVLWPLVIVLSRRFWPPRGRLADAGNCNPPLPSTPIGIDQT